MKDWFDEIAAGRELPAAAARSLLDSGFVVIPGPVGPERLARLAAAYDDAMADADPADISVGSTTTRVHGLVNRGAEFDELYVYRPVLEACCRVIGQPFRLSALLARTVRPHSQAQPLHADFKPDPEGWPMVGFILMVDEFRRDNGATRFVPGSHRWLASPDDLMVDPASDHEGQVLACGAAGSVIVYNGSVWHGHTANQSSQPRRSVQGAYVWRSAGPATNQAARVLPQTHARVGALAQYVLDCGAPD